MENQTADTSDKVAHSGVQTSAHHSCHQGHEDAPPSAEDPLGPALLHVFKTFLLRTTAHGLPNARTAKGKSLGIFIIYIACRVGLKMSRPGTPMFMEANSIPVKFFI